MMCRRPTDEFRPEAVTPAETILALRDDPVRRASLAASGRTLVRERFFVSAVGRSAVEAIRLLLAARAAAH